MANYLEYSIKLIKTREACGPLCSPAGPAHPTLNVVLLLFCHSPSLATPVACGPPLHSAAQSGPATSTATFLSPLQQTHCQASASWARKTPPPPTPLQPPVRPMTWDRPTTPGGYGALQSEEEALTLGLIRTSLMKIKIKQKTKWGPLI